MSTVNPRFLGTQQAITDYDLSKIFLFQNRYESDSWVNNSGYATLTLKAGTVMGRITSSGVLAPAISGNLDGSAVPIGILAQDVTLLAGQSQQVAICVAGDINANAIIFLGGDNLLTPINGRIMKDHLQAYGLLIRSGTEMTDWDN